MYTESLERKRSCLKSLPLIEVFDIDFSFSLPHFLTCRSISLLVNICKVDNDLPHVSALSNWVSTGNGSFIFCNRRLEILVADMIFDEIFTARSLVCLFLSPWASFSWTGKDYIINLRNTVYHCVKSVQIRYFFCSVFSHIRTEYGKIRTRKNTVFGHFSRSVQIIRFKAEKKSPSVKPMQN